MLCRGSNLLSQSIFSRLPCKFCLFASCVSLILQDGLLQDESEKNHSCMLNHYRIDCNRPAGARPTIETSAVDAE